MGCCIAEIAFFVFGIIALIKGEFQLSANRVVRSGPARVIGVLLMLPLLLGQGGEFVYGAVIGAKLAAQGKKFNPEELKAEITTTAIIINVVGGTVPLIAALCIALATAGPRRRPRPDDDYDDEDRPRRRRPRKDDEDDEDRPRRRRRADEEDEDDEDRPRRRRRDDDEDDEHIKER